ncbi:MAG TPA: hypothetical protein VF139_10095 [Candidatus Polarisedimenticolaceae bacterium]
MSGKRTLAESIEAMAAATGAPAAFVDRVRAMFVEKGISLEADAAPFEIALGDAFARQAAVHDNLELARRQLGTLRERMGELESGLRRHATELNRLRDHLRSAKKPASSTRLVPGEHDRFLVPGPDGLH